MNRTTALHVIWLATAKNEYINLRIHSYNGRRSKPSNDVTSNISDATKMFFFVISTKVQAINLVSIRAIRLT